MTAATFPIAFRRNLRFAATQRGISFVSLCLLVVVLVFAGYVVFRTVPVVTEYLAIQRALKQAATGATVLEVRQLFERQASIDYLDQYADPVRSQDLSVTKQNGVVVVELEYTREVPLFGPAYLTYKLHATSN
ncbi:hypothetical protein AAV94_13120 [Lampropedia cohaerens]|uniref:DUF4845 domain-containing protein n=1 Tax=Lampropedia cohaerens TaxID=1610491 RepID=A0A0U1PWS9_9BURK|nr:DUF4845 domain-containing protein [Lampropedia cohaerens]KKW66994.1 hypothetical protein AAV94_13120 [Lampropedia cohaerens]